MAIAATGESPEAELESQLSRLPEPLRDMVSQGVLSRLPKLRGLRYPLSANISCPL
jgi:hypothetical protein